MKTVIEMANEAGLEKVSSGWRAWTKDLAQFSELVRADERKVWEKDREQLMTQIGILRSQLLGMRMQFGEGSIVSNLSAALQAEDAVNAAAIRARSNT
jgi:predicted small integral membrane protein